MLFLLLTALAPPAEPEVLVYGATPAGIAAALSAAGAGRTVLLVEPTGRIGGLVTNGLSHTDFRTFEALTGTFLDFTRRVQTHYAGDFGPDAAKVCFRGTHAEPGVNLKIFERMLAEQPRIEVRTGLRLTQVACEDGVRITGATFGPTLSVRSLLYIDATCEGDLMAMAGVPFRLGREARAEYGESLAPETADAQVQAYNFRLILTQEPANRVLPPAPAGYRREDYLALVPMLAEGKFRSVFCQNTGGIYKAHRPLLPHGKYDINDVSKGLVRLSLPELSREWTEGDAAARDRLRDEYVRHNVGMLHFLQNDEAVPEKFRAEAREWGLCRDEFVDSGHVPPQVYVREGRRLVGLHVFIEGDTDAAAGDARSVLRTDAAASGDYGPNCHGTAHEGPRLGGSHTGEFYKPVAPYQIPYGVLVPRRCRNLLVPVACSASHVGFCALRLEPIWTSLGQAAGLAAHLAVEGGLPVQEVPVPKLQRLLHAARSATIYASDVPPGAPDFAAVQWWGTLGGLHGLAPAFEKPGQRGANITGQYFEAFPGHAVEPERALDEAVRGRWLRLAKEAGVEDPALATEATRGGFIRRAWEAR